MYKSGGYINFVAVKNSFLLSVAKHEKTSLNVFLTLALMPKCLEAQNFFVFPAISHTRRDVDVGRNKIFFFFPCLKASDTPTEDVSTLFVFSVFTAFSFTGNDGLQV